MDLCVVYRARRYGNEPYERYNIDVKRSLFYLFSAFAEEEKATGDKRGPPRTRPSQVVRAPAPCCKCDSWQRELFRTVVGIRGAVIPEQEG